MNHLIISCIGPDQTGLVDTLSKVISKHQGNWQVSSLHHLSGFFAGVIEVAVASEKSESLISALKAIKGLSCQIEVAEPNMPDVISNLVLEITANDRAGIVQEVSSVIHHQNGNLIKLVSSHDSAAHSGQDIFKAKVQIAIDDKSVDHLISALEQIADDLMVDISR
ncbi:MULTISPECIES: glycine cleavage system protein R [Colwellia]|jgi:glycine cleavage system regulatory protein|uniref:Glycine cleavage system transcriptional repressor n=1 Tax=Colwellia psychrerythraea (strain 34H / ATCC BAA-681) TaxID=167879 RepID=Q47XC3_COLP3|nr:MULTISPECIES: ACT domain-containing protein [Colwellia]AAZ23982.1 ACT domain protein [Colwellia psychrerythraea 34H]PKH86518.1 amino acid-binding protein [Colwellia sp. Bg11-28]